MLSELFGEISQKMKIDFQGVTNVTYDAFGHTEFNLVHQCVNRIAAYARKI